jgi:hypothetical protein
MMYMCLNYIYTQFTKTVRPLGTFTLASKRTMMGMEHACLVMLCGRMEQLQRQSYILHAGYENKTWDVS